MSYAIPLLCKRHQRQSRSCSTRRHSIVRLDQFWSEKASGRKLSWVRAHEHEVNVSCNNNYCPTSGVTLNRKLTWFPADGVFNDCPSLASQLVRFKTTTNIKKYLLKSERQLDGDCHTNLYNLNYCCWLLRMVSWHNIHDQNCMFECRIWD